MRQYGHVPPPFVTYSDLSRIGRGGALYVPAQILLSRTQILSLIFDVPYTLP